MSSFKARSETKAGRAALNAGVAHALSTASIVPVIAGYIAAGFIREDAKRIDAIVRDGVAASFAKRTGVMQKAAVATSPRVSEMAGMLKCGEWSCWKTLFDELGELGVSLAMLVKVTTWFRKRSGVAKEGGVCPSRAVLISVIKKAQPQKKASKPKTATELATAKPVDTIDNVIAMARGLNSGFAKRMGRNDSASLAALLKAAQALKPVLVAIVKADAAEAERIKAEAAK